MRAFQDYEIGWEGTRYAIPSTRLLPLIAAVEEIISVNELLVASVSMRVPLARLSEAYAVILRAAGVTGPDGRTPIAHEEVYLRMWDGGDVLARMKDAVAGLFGLMVPPEAVREAPAMPGKRQAAPG